MRNKILFPLLPILIGALFFFGSCEQEDTEAPTIRLYGSNHLLVKLNAEVPEPGYQAFDDEDGDITSKVEVTYPSTDLTGEYRAVYTVADEAGNGDTLKRIVTVFNEAEQFAGNFEVEYNAYPGGAVQYDSLATVEFDESTNKKLTFTEFSGMDFTITGYWEKVLNNPDKLIDTEASSGTVEFITTQLTKDRMYFEFTVDGQRYNAVYRRIN